MPHSHAALWQRTPSSPGPGHLRSHCPAQERHSHLPAAQARHPGPILPSPHSPRASWDQSTWPSECSQIHADLAVSTAINTLLFLLDYPKTLHYFPVSPEESLTALCGTGHSGFGPWAAVQPLVLPPRPHPMPARAALHSPLLKGSAQAAPLPEYSSRLLPSTLLTGVISATSDHSLGCPEAFSNLTSGSMLS